MGFYDDMADVATELLTEFGKPVTFERVTKTFNKITGKDTARTVAQFSTVGVELSINQRLIDGTRIQSGDRFIIVDSSYSPVMGDRLRDGGASVSCAYPLDDNGTLAAAFGYGYAGPAVGDGQQMQYTTTGNAQVKILLSSGATTSGRFQRTSDPIGFESGVSSYGGAANLTGLAIMITNSGGSIVNAATIESAADGDLLQFEVAPDGTVSAKKNGAAFDLSARWLNPAGQKTVGETDYFCPYLYINDQFTGQLVDIQLVTNAADMTGTYPSGATDICGNPVGYPDISDSWAIIDIQPIKPADTVIAYRLQVRK